MPRPAANRRNMTLPTDPLWSAHSVARLLGITGRHTIRLALQAGITERRYGRATSHPRKVRFFTEAEVKIIAAQRKKSWTTVQVPVAPRVSTKK